MIGFIVIENETTVDDALPVELPGWVLPDVGIVDEDPSVTAFRGSVSSESFTQLANARGIRIIAMRLMIAGTSFKKKHEVLCLSVRYDIRREIFSLVRL
jgi:hypothetical protein